MVWNNTTGRFNAGRPPIAASQRKVQSSVTIAPNQRAWLLEVGQGKLSQGIRRAVAIAMQVSENPALRDSLAGARLAKTAVAAAAAKAEMERVDAEVDTQLYGPNGTIAKELLAPLDETEDVTVT